MESNELNEKVKENDCKKIIHNIDYNIDYELYYNLFLNDEAFEEGETEEEKETIRTLLYQKDLLAIFNMNKFDWDKKGGHIYTFNFSNSCNSLKYQKYFERTV